VAIDSAGNIYAAGDMNGTDTHNFGNGISAAGAYIGAYGNILLVKYDKDGKAQWAKTVAVGTNHSDFKSVTTDSNGNIYASGFMDGTGTYNFGNGVTATGTAYDNIILIKYDSNGNAQWAKTLTSGTLYSCFTSIVVDSVGNIYAAGYVYGTDTYNFGNGITIAGTVPNYHNIALVKYDKNGSAQWARTITAAPGLQDSIFYSVTVDSTGNIYAAGYIDGTGAHNFGNGSLLLEYQLAEILCL